jgi:trans-aconitate methyltransferase
VFCNSALHWFLDREKAISAIHSALNSPGRLALTCPATEHF